MKDVHLCNYSSQPDIQIWCDDSWSEPAWNATSGLTDNPKVYESDDGRLYTFDLGETTCAKCLAKP